MRAVILAAFAGLMLAGCQAAGTPSTGHVSGLVGGWPAAPLGGDIAPAPNKTVEFHPDSGNHMQTATSGQNGRYDIDLVPGGYEVHLAGYQAISLTYARNPKTYGQWPHVTVTAGHTTRLDLIYDTGIR